MEKNKIYSVFKAINMEVSSCSITDAQYYS